MFNRPISQTSISFDITGSHCDDCLVLLGCWFVVFFSIHCAMI